ncbi:MAG TPA: hypothetical protein VH851_15975 [Candidatus Binatia bacterium]
MSGPRQIVVNGPHDVSDSGAGIGFARVFYANLTVGFLEAAYSG